MLTGNRCLIQLRKLLRLSLFISLAAVIVGCASRDRISDTDRDKITKVVVKESYTSIASGLSPYLPESPTGGLLSGTSMGLISTIITLNPLLLVITPSFAANEAKCGAEVSEVGEPAMKLKEIIDALDTRAFRRALDLQLLKIFKMREINAVAADKAGSSSKVSVADKILEVTGISFELSKGEAPTAHDRSRCHPVLTAGVGWRVINSLDGQQLEKGGALRMIPGSTETFKEWFANDALRRSEATALLECLGRTIAEEVLSGTSNPCDYTGEPATPPSEDYFLSCFSGGERKWTYRSKCD